MNGIPVSKEKLATRWWFYYKSWQGSSSLWCCGPSPYHESGFGRGWGSWSFIDLYSLLSTMQWSGILLKKIDPWNNGKKNVYFCHHAKINVVLHNSLLFLGWFSTLAVFLIGNKNMFYIFWSSSYFWLVFDFRQHGSFHVTRTILGWKVVANSVKNGRFQNTPSFRNAKKTGKNSLHTKLYLPFPI